MLSSPPRIIRQGVMGTMVALALGSSCPPAAACPAPPVPTPEITLDVTVHPDAYTEPQHFQVECLDGQPTDNTTVPVPQAACDDAAELGAEFFNDIPDPDRVCTKIYGGPQEAEVIGWIDGTRVHSHFSLHDGCAIERWRTAGSILGTTPI